MSLRGKIISNFPSCHRFSLITGVIFMLVLTNIKYAHAQQKADTTVSLAADTLKVDSLLAKDSLTTRKDSESKNSL
jgi:hypothetical protein